MNFLASALGTVIQVVQAVSESGQLHITTHKPNYVSGELITGTIYAQIHRPVSCRAIIVRCVGYEKCEWNNKSSRRVQRPGTGNDGKLPEYDTEHRITRYRGKKTFFDVAIPVYNLMDGVLLPGSYAWPFQYQLPVGVPGSFHERRELTHIEPGTIFEDGGEPYGENFYDSDDELDYSGGCQHGQRRYQRPLIHAVVHYKLKAVLDVNGIFAPDLHAKVGLVVHPQLTVPLVPQAAIKETNVTVCCCINKGTAKLQCAFDKNAYVAGETAQISADIDNQSTKELKMTVRLYRKLHMKDNAGRNHELNEVVNEANYDAAPPMQHCQKNLPLALSSNLIKPSIQGSFISCSYQYGVVGRVSWGSDIHINLPVHIYAPQPPPTVLAIPAWASAIPAPPVPAQAAIPQAMPMPVPAQAAPQQVVPVQPQVYAQAQQMQGVQLQQYAPQGAYPQVAMQQYSEGAPLLAPQQQYPPQMTTPTGYPPHETHQTAPAYQAVVPTSGQPQAIPQF